MLDSVKRFLGLIKTPTQLVDRMLFELRVIDKEEETEKPRKVFDYDSLLLIDSASINPNERLSVGNGMNH